MFPERIVRADQPTGEIGVVGGWVPGVCGEGTSMFGFSPGSSAGAVLGCAGCDGAGFGVGCPGSPGCSGTDGCCIKDLLLDARTLRPANELPQRNRVAPWAMPVIGPRFLGRARVA